MARVPWAAGYTFLVSRSVARTAVTAWRRNDRSFLESWREVSRNDALLWLNDRRGKDVHVAVRVTSALPITLLEASGRLRYWQEDAPAGAWFGPRGERRDDLEGWYIVGESSRFDLTDLDNAVFSVRNAAVLHVDVRGSASDVWLEIHELAEGQT
jgi:hypothetical protein